MKEVWKDIPDYVGYYQASNFGNVRGLKYKKVLKPSKDKDGYLRVNLCKKNIKKSCFVHRLVINSFLGKSDLTVNHIDKNKANNNINNLEYMTIKENNRYSKCKRVLQFDKKNNFIKEWLGAMEIEKCLHIPNNNISNCCNHIRKSAGGFVWVFKNE